MPNKVDLTGQRFGKLVALRDVGRLHGGVLWECICDCGKTVNVRQSNLKSGDSKTCGKRKQCHHAWGGGHKNVGSKAWASKKLTAMRVKASQRNHAAPTCDPETFLEIWNSANGACSICQKTEADGIALCVDHCHDTGTIRGILCNNCNAGIGMLGDDVAMLEKAISYLQPHCEGVI